MTLAHLPTAKAQLLLKDFKKSGRVSEITWLDFAMEEGQMWLLNPENEQEAQDLMVLQF